MQYFNIIAVLMAAIVPVIMNYLWSLPSLSKVSRAKVVGGDEGSSSGRTVKSLLLTYLMGFLVAFVLNVIVFHQNHVGSMMQNYLSHEDATVVETATKDMEAFLAKYGGDFLTFGHGAIHGLLTAVFLILPILVIISQRGSYKAAWIWHHWSYWAICLVLMGGLICAWH